LGNDVFVIASTEATPAVTVSSNVGSVVGFDVITDIETGTVAAAKDLINLPGTPVLATATAGTNGTDSTAYIGSGTSVVKSHAISASGQITFNTADTYAAATVVSVASDADLAAVMEYLKANDIGDAGATVWFTASYAASTRGSSTHSFVYSQTATTAGTTGGCSLVDLVGVSVVGVETTASTTDLIPYIG
jgi:hypothetical protein